MSTRCSLCLSIAPTSWTFHAQLLSARLEENHDFAVDYEEEHKKEVFGLYFTILFVVVVLLQKMFQTNCPGYLLLYAKLVS